VCSTTNVYRQSILCLTTMSTEAEKHSPEADKLVSREEFEALKAERDAFWKQNRSYKAQLERQRRDRLLKETATMEDSGEEKPSSETKIAPAVEKKESLKASEGISHEHKSKKIHCDTCNEDLADEAQCESCGYHLGTKEHAEKIGKCPSCGGTKAKLIELIQ
jgi:predicted Zn-ribbon and HTH transcriptional regulator